MTSQRFRISSLMALHRSSTRGGTQWSLPPNFNRWTPSLAAPEWNVADRALSKE